MIFSLCFIFQCKSQNSFSIYAHVLEIWIVKRLYLVTAISSAGMKWCRYKLWTEKRSGRPQLLVFHTITFSALKVLFAVRGKKLLPLTTGKHRLQPRRPKDVYGSSSTRLSFCHLGLTPSTPKVPQLCIYSSLNPILSYAKNLINSTLQLPDALVTAY